jgi:uncharacterized membrane protein
VGRVLADARPHGQNVSAAASVRAWTLGADAVIAAAIVLGAAVRIVQYAANRSLWLDESALALNIIDRSAGALLGPLALAQAAPPGFLLAEKGLTHLFGKGELALRLFPLLASLAALVLFALLARRVLGRWTAALATVLLASAANLIYYGSEVKQYSGDVAATLLLLLLGVLLYERPDRGRWAAAAFALGGAVVLFFSYAAVFPAAAIAVVLAVREVARQRRRISPALVSAVAWGLASVLVVAFSRRTTGSVQFAFKDTPGAYVGSASSGVLDSLREPPSALARDAGILPMPSVFYWGFVLLALVGLFGVARRRLAYAAFFVGATLLMLIASWLNRYPVADRTILFLVPVAILLVAEGVTVVAGIVRRPLVRRAAATALALAVVAVPGWRALTRLVHPEKHEEIKSAIAVIRSGWQPGDTLYISNPTAFALRYYLECGCITTPSWPFVRTNLGNSTESLALDSRPPKLIAGTAPLKGHDTYVTEVREKLRGRPRVWLLYSHAGSDTELNFLRRDLPKAFSTFGTQKRVYLATGVTLFLYDFRR